jgi:hypothetical protein
MKFTLALFLDLLILMALPACKSPLDIDYIKSTGWSYDGGYRITDFLTFDTTGYYSIKVDTIFVENKPQAIILSLDKKEFHLSIRSLDGEKVGHYTDERGMLH